MKTVLIIALLFSTMAYAELPPVNFSEKQAVYALCADFRAYMSRDKEYRADFLSRLLKAADDEEVLKIKQDAGVPQVCIDADEY